MKLYNPLTWPLFAKHEKRQDAPLELRCANPQCRRVIEGNNIAYIPQFKEFYHPGECSQIAIGHRLMKSGAPHIFVENVQYPSRKDAIKIALKNKVER